MSEPSSKKRRLLYKVGSLTGSFKWEQIEDDKIEDVVRMIRISENLEISASSLCIYQSDCPGLPPINKNVDVSSLGHNVGTEETPLYVPYDRHADSLPAQKVPADEAWFEALRQAQADKQWLSGEFSKDPIFIRPCYQKFAAILFGEASLNEIPMQTFVMKGTPGIGKTTMLYYLLWRCMQEDSPFKTVLFATEKLYVLAQKKSSKWTIEDFDTQLKVHARHGKAIALVDVTPDGTVKNIAGISILLINKQGPCTVLGVDRLVVGASAEADLGQLIDHTGDGWPPKVLWVPIWHPSHAKIWAEHLGIKIDDELVSECGLCVPRLIELAAKKAFQGALSRFMTRINPQINPAKQSAAAKDAHTMVLLQCSSELREEAEEGKYDSDRIGPVSDPSGGGQDGVSEGEPLGLASRCVEKAIVGLGTQSMLSALKRLGKRIAPQVFELMVLEKLQSLKGLELRNDEGDPVLLLHFNEVCELWCVKTVQERVLYRPKSGDYPAVDAVGVSEVDGQKKLILIQITKGRRHRRIQQNLVEKIHVPRTCVGVLCLYIVATAVQGLELINGDDPLLAGGSKGNKPVQEKTLSARSAIQHFPGPVQEMFEPGQ